MALCISKLFTLFVLPTASPHGVALVCCSSFNELAAPRRSLVVSDNLGVESWWNFLIVFSAVSGGKQVATAPMHLSASWSFSFGVACFVCSNWSSIWSTVFDNLSFFAPAEAVEDPSCRAWRSFVLFARVSDALDVVFCLRVGCKWTRLVTK